MSVLFNIDCSCSFIALSVRDFSGFLEREIISFGDTFLLHIVRISAEYEGVSQ